MELRRRLGMGIVLLLGVLVSVARCGGGGTDEWDMLVAALWWACPASTALFYPAPACADISLSPRTI
jgi:hypothetical protein